MSAFSDKDFRLVTVASACWIVAGTLTASQSSGTSLAAYLGISAICGVIMFVSAAGSAVCTYMQYSCLTRLKRILCNAFLCAFVGVIIVLSSFLHARVMLSDISHEALKPAYSEKITVSAYAVSPMTSSSRRGFTCSVHLRIDVAQIKGISQVSSASALLFISDSNMCTVEDGARYVISGKAQQPRWGRENLWIEVDNKCVQCVTKTRSPPLWKRGVSYIHQAFLRQTHKLDTSAQILVPGVTMGVMGNDAVIDATSLTPNDEAASDAQHVARRIKANFKTAGIMHVLAVSGGHFALASGFVTWLSRRFLWKRRVRALTIIVSIVCVSVLMYPSESLLRAQVMGTLMAGFTLLGRRAHSQSALCWTAIMTLIMDPTVSMSIGFMLSCAAVLGIVALSERCKAILDHWFTKSWSNAISVTLCAQICTLPITVVLAPDVPVYAVLANMLISIPMDIATLCGIMSLVTSWISPHIGFGCAWCAGVATTIMARICEWVATLPCAVVHCTPIQMCAFYGLGIILGGLLAMLIRGIKRHILFESMYHRTIKEQMRIWRKDIIAYLTSDSHR
ncbi:ComEC/Rec2 family competence protein [Alloscardovia venturai]|uniref:ComEC/Rec2 family competence protein n=1 Tax=Alloscardovia venturai TaxID=1769421 RepID=A0ABW2Y443_9BIFI